MTRSELASFIDHTLLKPDAVPDDIERLCEEAIRYGFYSVCINPLWVSLASEILRESRPIVCSVIGFPLGAINCMGEEAVKAVDLGAGELDMVIPIGHLKGGYIKKTAGCIQDVVRASSGKPVKVILETCLLTDEEKVLACRIAMDSGASWVKTSTGFSSGGATVSDVALMRSAVGKALGVKASGGIRTLTVALEMIGAGAGRLGCSGSVDIIESLNAAWHRSYRIISAGNWRGQPVACSCPGSQFVPYSRSGRGSDRQYHKNESRHDNHCNNDYQPVFQSRLLHLQITSYFCISTERLQV